MKSEIQYKKYLISIVLIFITGLFAGIKTGKHTVAEAFYGRINPLIILFYPSKNYVDTVRYLNSSDPLKRLAGYYAYGEVSLVDYDYLYDRFIEEEISVIRNTIIWIASRQGRTAETINFFSRIFRKATEVNQKFMLNYIEKNDPQLYNDFVENNKSNK